MSQHPTRPEGGYGVVASTWPREVVESVGRNLERGRFKKLGCHSARLAALTAAGFVQDGVTAEWKAGWLSDADYLSTAGWGLNQPGVMLAKDW